MKEFTLSVSYKIDGMIGSNPEKDKSILKCVDHEPCDIGSGFGYRDIAWYFKDEQEAKDAKSRLDLIDGVETSLDEDLPDEE